MKILKRILALLLIIPFVACYLLSLIIWGAKSEQVKKFYKRIDKTIELFN